MHSVDCEMEGVFCFLALLLESLLMHFVGKTEDLYGKSAMTFNMHQLIHLPEAVRRLGPLWGHSAFVFESGNGQLVKLVTGANAVPQQILERVVVSQQVECFLASTLVPDYVREQCRGMLGYPKLKNVSENEGVILLGHPRRHEITVQEKNILSEHVSACPDFASEYQRFAIKGQIFHSRSYRKPRKSDSSVVQARDFKFFVILRVVCISSEVFLLCREIVTNESGVFPGHIQEAIISQVPGLHLLKPIDVKAACLFIQFPNCAEGYVCTLPNEIERD